MRLASNRALKIANVDLLMTSGSEPKFRTHNREPHVPLGCGLRPKYYALTSRSLFEVQEALSTAAEAHATIVTLKPMVHEDTLMVFDFIVRLHSMSDQV